MFPVAQMHGTFLNLPHLFLYIVRCSNDIYMHYIVSYIHIKPKANSLFYSLVLLFCLKVNKKIINMNIFMIGARI